MSKDITELAINGIGWVNNRRGGSIFRDRLYDFENPKELYKTLIRKNVISEEIENFGRFPISVRRVVCGIALTLSDTDRKTHKHCALIGTDPGGSLEANIEYFRDYVDGGREMGRANLFIYTLSSSPLAESAIAFNLDGPLFYIRASESPVKNLLVEGKRLIGNNETDRAILVNNFHSQNIIFSLREAKNCGNYLKWSELETALSKVNNPVSNFDHLLKVLNEKCE